MRPSTTLPVPVAPPEAVEFAEQKGAGEYLPRMLELARRVFPQWPIVVSLYEDPELRDERSVLIHVQVPRDADFKSLIAPSYTIWREERHKTCPSRYIHVFGLTFDTVL